MDGCGGRGRITLMHAQPTHLPTHPFLPTYPHTKAREQAARELHASCARARTHEGDDENASEGEGECEGEDEAEGDDDGDCDGGGQPAACGKSRWPPAVSRWSLAASRCPPPAAKVKMTMSCVQLNSTYLSYHQCSSRSLPPWPGEKCSAQLKIMPHIQLKNMPRIHVKMNCPMEKHASNSCDYDLSQLKNMPRSHVKTYRLELQI